MFYCTLFTIIKIAYLYYVPMLLVGEISFGQRAGCAGGRKKKANARIYDWGTAFFRQRIGACQRQEKEK